MQRDIVVRGIQSPYPMVVIVTHTYHHAMEYMLKTLQKNTGGQGRAGQGRAYM